MKVLNAIFVVVMHMNYFGLQDNLILSTGLIM